MADNIRESSTSNYTMGYGDAQVHRLNQRTAAILAAYLLPHLQPGMRMLDIGCGPGSISVGLAAAVGPGEFYGIDMEASQVDLATAAAREAGLSNTRFQVADALDLPFSDNHFDAVHCCQFLMHIPDTMAALAEIKRVLKPGGVLGARDAMVEHDFYEPNIGDLYGISEMFSAVMTSNGGHPQMGRELRARFTEAGFVDVESTGSVQSWGSPSGIAFLVNDLLWHLDPPFADTAISRGFATREEIEGWRKALDEWKDHPGAFAGWPFGQAVGRKP